MARALSDPTRSHHTGYALMFLLVILVLGLGFYESWAALARPDASLVHTLAGGGANGSRPVALTADAQPSLYVQRPTQVYSAAMDPLWVAAPGQRYDVLRVESGWALAILAGDGPESAVWIQTDTGAGGAPALPMLPIVGLGMAVLAILLGAAAIAIARKLVGRRRVPAARAPVLAPSPSTLANHYPNGESRTHAA